MQTRHALLALLLPVAVHAADTAPAPARAGFNPDISLILAGRYAGLSNDPETYAIPGFMLGEETGPGPRGLALAESELVVSANVDDLFYGQFTAAVTPDNEVELEEAFVQTLGLGHGLGVRAGRFLSGIGYLNGQHPHSWDFVDTALPYRALLANHYGDDGLRITWVAPTEVFFELGGEWLRGANFPAGGDGNDGQGVTTLFAHVGGDVGASHAWRAGLSVLRAQVGGRLSGDVENAPDAFAGDSRVAIADFVWKWAPHGNPKQRHFKFQAEYLWRDEDGAFTSDVDGVNGAPVTDAYAATQSGWYAQAVYQFIPRWRAGLRYDQLCSHEVQAGANAALFDTLGHTPRRASVMLDWSRSEFSRVRVQVTRDHSQPDSGGEVFVQYIMSLGAHGAHAF
jgi:hypothetical protein